MKREEMIRILEKSINESLYQDYQFTDEQINNILTDIEKAGMLPPTVKESCYCSMRGSCPACSSNYYYYNRWED